MPDRADFAVSYERRLPSGQTVRQIEYFADIAEAQAYHAELRADSTCRNVELKRNGAG